MRAKPENLTATPNLHTACPVFGNKKQEKCKMKLISKRNMLSKFLCIVLIVAMALCLGGCGKKEVKEYSTDVIENGKSYGSGAKEFIYKVVDPEGNEVSATIKTDKATVGEALMELNFIAGDQGDFGLYMKCVNNITLDWDKDAMYWALYENGEYGLTGIELTEIVNGAEYTLKAEK